MLMLLHVLGCVTIGFSGLALVFFANKLPMFPTFAVVGVLLVSLGYTLAGMTWLEERSQRKALWRRLPMLLLWNGLRAGLILGGCLIIAFAPGYSTGFYWLGAAMFLVGARANRLQALFGAKRP
jgi:hypothetical protein